MRANIIDLSGEGELLTHCREYRSLKQRKQCEYKRKCLHDIELAYKNNKSSIWSILNAIDNENNVIGEPSDDEFNAYSKNECDEQTIVLMSNNYEHEARAFLDRYDKTGITNFDSEIETYMINMNFSEDEISSAIDTLKSIKSPGLDAIPAGFIKHCKDILSRDITTIVNYIIEERNFPDMWAESLRSAVFKSGKRSLVNNYRGITIFPIVEKAFEVAVYRRMSFASEVMGKFDKYNGGFINGSRTSGGHLNKKDGLTRYGDSHVKDKTS